MACKGSRVRISLAPHKPHSASLVWLFYLLSLIPLLAIAFFNYPSADDINMGVRAHDAFLETGSFLAAWGQGFYMAWYDYLHWMGYFTSTALMSVPPSVFGEHFYAIGTFLLIFSFTASVTFFLHTLLGRLIGVEHSTISIVCALTLFLCVQSLPAGMARVEAFYWYCSGANYILTACLGLVWLALLIRLSIAEKARPMAITLTGILGFLTGGGNMMTALTCAIIAVLVLIRAILPQHGGVRGRIFLRLLWPSVGLLIGFLASCLAPGNSVRESIVAGFSPIKAIAVSLHYTASFCINQWTRIEHFLVLAFLAPLFWAAAPKAELSFRFPLIVTALAYGLTSANITPPLYALGQINAGRLQTLFYLQYILLLVLTEGYLIGWLRLRVLNHALTKQPNEAKDKSDDAKATFFAYYGVIITAFFLLSALAVAADSDYYTATTAIQDLSDGTAARYKEENEVRLRILQDVSVTDAVLTPYQNHPALLFFSDLDPDPDNWLNDGAARYYHKNSVRLKAVGDATEDEE